MVDGAIFYPQADGSNTGAELWVSSGGSTPDTVLTGQYPQGLYYEGISPLTADQPLGKVFFTATDEYNVSGNDSSGFINDSHGVELYVSDGTEAGTYRVADINQAPADLGQYPADDAASTGDADPTDLTVTADGTLYFAANDGTNEGLWTYDTAGNLSPVHAFGPSATTSIYGLANQTNFFTIDNQIYFLVNTAASTQQLWTSNGATTTELASQVSINNPTTDGTDLYFTATSNNLEEVWRTDGTLAGTVPITTHGAAGPFAVLVSDQSLVTVNAAPSGTDNSVSLVPTYQTVPPYATIYQHVFTVADFGFSDPNGADFAAVEITTLPGTGKLLDNNVAVSAGQFIPVADLTGNKLVFQASDRIDQSFTFQVQDDGGTANGGADTDPSPNTITLHNDLPPQLNRTTW